MHYLAKNLTVHMSISEEIITIANIIANNGKKPSVALIKTKLTSKVPLPVIISTLKVWQHDPSFISVKNENSTKAEMIETTAITNELSQLIAEALAPINKELANLKLEINRLKKLNAKITSN